MAKRQRTKTQQPVELVSTVEIPVDQSEASGYVARHLDMHLSQPQAETLRRVLSALNGRNERLSDGRHVTTRTDVVRWLLERVEDGVASKR